MMRWSLLCFNRTTRWACTCARRGGIHDWPLISTTHASQRFDWVTTAGTRSGSLIRSSVMRRRLVSTEWLWRTVCSNCRSRETCGMSQSTYNQLNIQQSNKTPEIYLTEIKLVCTVLSTFFIKSIESCQIMWPCSRVTEQVTLLISCVTLPTCHESCDLAHVSGIMWPCPWVRSHVTLPTSQESYDLAHESRVMWLCPQVMWSWLESHITTVKIVVEAHSMHIYYMAYSSSCVDK